MGEDSLDGLLLHVDKFVNTDEANTQAPGSDFTGTSLAVLKGAKQLLTDKFLQVHHWLF